MQVSIKSDNLKQNNKTLQRGHYLGTTQNQNEVFLELLETERTYVQDLEKLINGLLRPLQRSIENSAKGIASWPLLPSVTMYGEQLRHIFRVLVLTFSSSVSSLPPILEEDEIKTLFINIEDILKHHKKFLHRIEWVMLWSGPYTKASTLGNLFLQECQFFDEYKPFFEGYTNALSFFEELKIANPAFADLLQQFDEQQRRNGEMAFESILITPAQR